MIGKKELLSKLFGVLLIVLAGVHFYFEDPPEPQKITIQTMPRATPTPTPPPTLDEQARLAFAMAQIMLEDHLKAPSTAEFPLYTPGQTKKLSDDDIWEIKSYVDAQNSFGAMLRTRFVMVIQDRGDVWHLLSLEIK